MLFSSEVISLTEKKSCALLGRSCVSYNKHGLWVGSIEAQIKVLIIGG